MLFFDIFKTKQYKDKISQLETEVTSLEENFKNREEELNYQIARFKKRINSLEAELSKQENFIKSISPIYDIKCVELPYSFDKLQALWAKWDINMHNYNEQIIRQERACSFLLSPLDLDIEHAQGHFRGKEHDYLTTLCSCECIDFQRRLKPCKHMYRLAYELDVFMLDEVQFDPNIKNLMRIGDVKKIVDSLTSNQKEIFREVAINNGCIVENRTFLKPLLTNKLVQISSDKTLLLNYYTKEDLFSFLPNDSNISKSIKKSKLIDIIIADYPQIISNIEITYVYVELNNNIQHLASEIQRIL